ncbi:hypothetical protein M405DRAFT_821217 [Rhizopogon salebrosus TDB-379]|nr:hypothetical protein M405DRAFT_821217 [Rhizopogon salebrosus TDB-379]
MDLQGSSTGRPHVLRSLTADYQSFKPPNGTYPLVPSSSFGTVHVLGYAPAEGEDSVHIVVNFKCTGGRAAGCHIRLVVGRRAVRTKVRELEPPGYGYWQLEAAVPPFVRHNSTTPNVPLTIQVVTDDDTLFDDGTVVDSVTFGQFTYLMPEVKTVRLMWPGEGPGPAHRQICRYAPRV